MATDVYVQLDGVKGESNDERHKDWIEALSVTWGGTQPKSATASTAGGHSAERVNLRDVVITKFADLSTPKLFALMCQGKTIPKAIIQFMRADGNAPMVYMELILENVLISECAPSFTGAGLAHEAIALRYSKINVKYTQQKIGGGSGGNTMGGWDAATNRPL